MSAIALPFRQNTPAWVDARRDVLGSSDIAIVTGNSPYRTSLYSLWAIKTRRAEPEPIDPETQELFDLGHALEPVIADRYTLMTGRPVKRAMRMLVHRTDPWMGASLDRVSAVKGERRIIEVKWVPHRRWQTDGPEPVPAHVQDQVQWQLMVTGYDVADVAVLNGSRVQYYEIGPLDAYQDDLRYLARHLWDFVERGMAPPVDGSESTRQTLAAIYPRETLGMVDPTPELAALAYRIRDTKAALKAAEAAAGEPANVMRSLLGEGTGVEGEDYRVTWTLNADGSKTDWKSVAAGYRHLLDAWVSGEGPERFLDADAIASVESIHTVTTEGSRVLRTRFRNEEDGKWF